MMYKLHIVRRVAEVILSLAKLLIIKKAERPKYLERRVVDTTVA